jgi:3'-phosphoadenosine 5'-phosphosulfate sulfotransferase (PAPS reductase)/FAD synthetase
MPSQNYNQPITVKIAPVRPSAIVVSLSGGKDSTELLRRIVMEYLAALGWNDVPVMCHHQVVEEDWSGTLEYCQQICEHFRVPLYLSRAHYHGYVCKNPGCDFQTLTVREREPEPTREREREREGEVVNCKCDKCAQPTLEKIAEVTNLRELMGWRKAYPSSKVRFCTSYLKRDVFNLWVRQHRHLLGATPIVGMGERWAESPGWKKLPVVRLRESVSTKDFQMYEWRPILHLSRQQVFRGILLGEGTGGSEGADTGADVSAPGVVGVARAKARANEEGGVLDVRPCYYSQGLTRQQMLDENVEGGPRMSCVFCFYNTDKQLQINGQLPQNRELLESFIRTEEEIGYTIRQGISLRQIIGVGVGVDVNVNEGARGS